MGMLLTYRPGYYPGDALEDDGKRAAVKAAGARGDSVGDEFAGLSDEQVAEQYAERVGGNATTRRGQLKALRKLEPVENPTEQSGGQPDPENDPDPANEPGQPDPENDPEDADKSDPEGE